MNGGGLEMDLKSKELMDYHWWWYLNERIFRKQEAAIS